MPTTPPEASRRAASESHRPWLFYRPKLDWCWKSFRRVVEEARETTSGPPVSAPYAADPETIVRLLASGAVEARETDAAELASLLPEHDEQPIVFASPSIVRALAPTLTALTRRLQAAWPLEPADDAFVNTAVWLRPTVLLALDEELRRVAAAWDDGVRKWSRLRSVVRVVPAADADPAPVDDLAVVFGVPVVDFAGP